MFAMKEYPNDVMPLYSQGHSLAQWLIENRGRKVFLEFLADGMQDENWPRAVEQYYGFDGLSAMQNSWLDWVKSGRPQITPESSPMVQLASHTAPKRSGDSGAEQPIVRTQSPDDITPISAAEPPTDKAKTAAVTVASASGSVYAQAAARAERERRKAVPSPTAAAKSRAPSVYDASVNTGVIRR
jgi:hypothetical protein